MAPGKMCYQQLGGSGKRQLADGSPIHHRQSLRPCRCHPDIFHPLWVHRRSVNGCARYPVLFATAALDELDEIVDGVVIWDVEAVCVCQADDSAVQRIDLGPFAGRDVLKH